jgi:hypothetical protein
MSDSPSLIMIQFLSWVADRPRTYAQTMEAWRTSCPRLSVWEDAVIEDLVRIDGGHRAVTLTLRGHAVLRKSQAGTGPKVPSAPPNGKDKPVRGRQPGFVRRSRSTI